MSREKFAKAVGARMKQARKDLGWTQMEMADYIGTSQSTLNRMEVGSRFPDVFQVAEVARVSGYQLLWLITGEGIPKYDSSE